MSVDDQASSRFPWPPAIYGAAVVAAALVSWLLPLPFLPDAAVWPLRVIGGLIVVAAIGLAMVAEREFGRARTPALSTMPTRAIVTSGAYAYSRNPMYLSMTIGLAALALVIDSLWFIVAVPFALYAVTKLAIEREERYLAGKFGETYRAYKARVPRWLGRI